MAVNEMNFELDRCRSHTST